MAINSAIPSPHLLTLRWVAESGVLPLSPYDGSPFILTWIEELLEEGLLEQLSVKGQSAVRLTPAGTAELGLLTEVSVSSLVGVRPLRPAPVLSQALTSVSFVSVQATNLTVSFNAPGLNFEVSIDGGTSWSPLPVTSSGTNRQGSRFIPAGNYAAGQLRVRPVGVPAASVSNAGAVTVAGGGIANTFPTAPGVFYSFDGTAETYRLFAGNYDTMAPVTGAAYTTSQTGRSVRDPQVTERNGVQRMLHTNVQIGAFYSNSQNLALAGASNGKDFAFLSVLPTSTDTNATSWTPRLFTEGAQDFIVFAYSSVANAAQSNAVNMLFQPSYVPVSSDLFGASPAVGARVAITGTAIPTNAIDYSINKRGSLYYLWYKNEATKYLGYCTSSAPFTGYNTGSGDLLALGQNIEGAAFYTFNGIEVITYDKYGTNEGMAYRRVDNTGGQFSTFGPEHLLSPAGSVIRHGSLAPAGLPLSLAPPADAVAVAYTGTPLLRYRVADVAAGTSASLWPNSGTAGSSQNLSTVVGTAPDFTAAAGAVRGYLRFPGGTTPGNLATAGNVPAALLGANVRSAGLRVWLESSITDLNLMGYGQSDGGAAFNGNIFDFLVAAGKNAAPHWQGIDRILFGSLISVGQWVDLGVIVSAAGGDRLVQLYENGALVASFTTSSATAINTLAGPLRVGAATYPGINGAAPFRIGGLFYSEFALTPAQMASAFTSLDASVSTVPAAPSDLAVDGDRRGSFTLAAGTTAADYEYETV